VIWDYRGDVEFVCPTGKIVSEAAEDRFRERTKGCPCANSHPKPCLRRQSGGFTGISMFRWCRHCRGRGAGALRPATGAAMQPLGDAFIKLVKMVIARSFS
jgi:hypothetical protein